MALTLLFVASALNQLHSCSYIVDGVIMLFCMQPADIMQVIMVLQVYMLTTGSVFHHGTETRPGHSNDAHWSVLTISYQTNHAAVFVEQKLSVI